jgi:Protein of unknown function (DUF4435)
MSQLQDEITGSSVAAEIVMLRAAANKSILIVEGGTDWRLMSVFVDLEVCDIVISFGRDNALEALTELRLKSFIGILCILDIDYLDHFGKLPRGEEIVFTDEHDMEIMLIRSSAFDRLLAEMGSRDKLESLRVHGNDLREMTRDAGHEIGILRMFSQRDELNLTFSDLRYRFVDRTNLSVNVSTMIDEVYNLSGRTCARKEGLIRDIAEFKSLVYDIWRICSGHDLTAILGRALRSVFGNESAQSTKVNEIESKLRMAFGLVDFRATRMFRAIVDWERANAPYVVLRDDVRGGPI